ncbi:LytR/AlgR family response regulator transcription factor [Riemerella columbina]|uniref:LytR/AlgR family response regulator transcription factor n=1 Tax=Riemerella columbina TaxID=103810 RepID=UPI00266F0AB0|nr:LytTR family DNA-binding domain-containing protein [Riemerella columbina]WKS95177.1 LytTR family DNA-binding domain-containing protein [Riemerella columbina]
MIKTVIIEDEALAMRRLQKMLSHFPEVEIVGVIRSVAEGVAYFKNHPHPDLILSDIALGDGLSFDIFEEIPTQSFIIYTTAFDQYTLRAFQLNSIDYLLKPFTQEALQQAIEKYKTFRPPQQSYQQLNFRELIQKEPPKLARLLVKIGYNLKIIAIEEVLCFYTEHKIVYAQTAERAYPIDFSLEELEKVLEPTLFFRVNRQTILGLSHIKNIHTSPTYTVELYHHSTPISISRERVKNFKDWLEGKN